MAKVVLLGLAGFDPALVQQWLEDLPTLRDLQREGIWGVHAWSFRGVFYL